MITTEKKYTLKKNQYFKFSIHFETVFCHPNMMGKSHGTNKENISAIEFVRRTDYTTSHWHWHLHWIGKGFDASRSKKFQQDQHFSTNPFLKVVGGIKCEDSWALCVFSLLWQNLMVVISVCRERGSYKTYHIPKPLFPPWKLIFAITL